MRHLKRIAGALVLAASVSALATEKLPGPLLEGLGDLHHPITTKSEMAQNYFDQGMRLLFGFNHKEAIRSFRSAAYLDPECAMAYWGEAYAFGPHVNKPMDANDTTAAWSALQKAVALKDQAPRREQAYIRALEKRYQAEHQDDRSALDAAFASAMREVVREYPDDLDAQTIFAESLMNTMPWDYWTRDRSPKPETKEILAALRYVMARNPSHPGANHFYIHAVEAGPNPESGLAAADRLREYAPSAGHLVHMPGHIYMRVGQYADAVQVNLKAEKADRDYIQQCRALGFYSGAYYPHNMHFLWWAQLMDGRGGDALRTATETARYARDNYCGPSKAVEAPRLRHLPWMTLMRLGRWEEILALPQPANTNDFIVDRAVWHFTRGVAYATKGDAAAAASEHEALEKIVCSEEIKKLNSAQFPVADALAIANHWLVGKVAGARGDNTKMIEHLQKAVSAEEAMPYMEPSYWPIPVRPVLAAAYLQAGDAARAEQAFREDLVRWPRNGWSLYGLEQALLKQGKNESAALVHRELEEAWKRADVKLALELF